MRYGTTMRDISPGANQVDAPPHVRRHALIKQATLGRLGAGLDSNRDYILTVCRNRPINTDVAMSTVHLIRIGSRAPASAY